jgi:hypothetical protein
MKRISQMCSVTLGTLLAAMLPFSTLAQPPKDNKAIFPMEGTDPIQLLMFKQIQNELKLNTEQIDKLAKLNKRFQAKLLLQIYEWGRLMDPEVIKSVEAVLDITPEQKKALALLREQTQLKITLSQSHNPVHGLQEHRDIIAKDHDFRKQVMKESGAKVAQILSHKQRQMLKRLEDNTFEFEGPLANPHSNGHMKSDDEGRPF